MNKLLTPFFELLRRVGTQRRYQVAFGLWVGGPAMIIGSILLEDYKIGPHLIWILLLEGGIACIIAAIAEFILLEHASEIFRQEVRQDTKILTHCLEHQLLDILPPRKQEHSVAIEAINAAIKNTRTHLRNARTEICIIAFTLQDISNDILQWGPLNKLLNRNAEVGVKLLLIDPKSPAAHMRVIAEEGPGTLFKGSQLDQDLQASIKEIKKMKAKAEAEPENKFTIEARFCNILPTFYMVSTPNEVFIEPYHLGHDPDGDPGGGGTVPLLRFSSKSPMYKFAGLHFSYLWESFENGNQRANGHSNGYMQIRSMDQVSERRKLERRRNAAPVPVSDDRRSEFDRRDLRAS